MSNIVIQPTLPPKEGYRIITQNDVQIYEKIMTPDECLAALNEENQILTSAIDTLMTVILPGIMGV